MKPSIGWGFSLILGVSLVTCSLTSSILDRFFPLPPTPSSTSTPASTITPAPSFTPSSSPSPTFTPSQTPSLTETSTSSLTPSLTPNPYVYFFPVQPVRDTGFSEGGHAYPATDIFAPIGDRFVAVTSGVVDFVSYQDRWDPAVNDPNLRGGLCVAIIGDDGWRYYGAHLSKIAPGIARGVRVKAGQLLGLVGTSGDAAGKPSHLHFGISPPTYPEDWHTRRGEVDPVPYLIAWKHGENLTPALPTPTPILPTFTPTP